MRVLLGLAALAVVSGQTVTPDSATSSSKATFPQPGQSALISIQVQQQFQGGATATNITPSLGSGFLNTNNWQVTVANSITALNFVIGTNTYVGQLQYRWFPNYSFGSTYTCDPCAGGPSTTSCNVVSGPGTGNSPTAGFNCANLNRNYLFSGIQQSTKTTTVTNSLSFQLFDVQTSPFPNLSSWSFTIIRTAPAVIVGDPQIVGMQGQDFQVHGMPDEIFNVVSYPSLQVNARFTYLESGACHDNFTACFAHPGTYISEEGFRVGKDKIRVVAGSFKKGLTVSVNGKKVHSNVDLKAGAVEIVNHRRVIVHTDIMKISVSNSDHFLNQELELADDKLVSLGSSRKVLRDSERFHPEVPLHGLQGQTWRNVEYPSGLEYEGSIMDYHVVDGNIFGTDFVFNQFTQ